VISKSFAKTAIVDELVYPHSRLTVSPAESEEVLVTIIEKGSSTTPLLAGRNASVSSCPGPLESVRVQIATRLDAGLSV
jgi:hypothetical protein